MLAPLLPRFDRAHDALVRFESPRATDATERRVAELTTQLNELDGHHDRIARGIYGLLTALAELSNDVSTRDTLLQLRDELLPLGLREIQRTYLEQSGNLQRVHDHVLPRSTVLLQTVPLPEGGTLADLVAGWAELGPEFDRLDSSRRSLRRELEAMVPTGTLIDARGEWIRLVNAMLAGADLERLSPVDEARVFDPMREAEAKADRQPPPPAPGTGVVDPTGTPPTTPPA